MAADTPVASAEPWRFDDGAVQAQEHAAVDAARVDAFGQAFEAAKREEGGEFRQGRGVEGFAQELADEAGGAFAGFQRDIAGEAVGDDHVDPARRDIAAFDEADEFEIGMARVGRDQLIRFFQLGAALVFFGADIQQADARGVSCQDRCARRTRPSAHIAAGPAHRRGYRRPHPA